MIDQKRLAREPLSPPTQMFDIVEPSLENQIFDRQKMMQISQNFEGLNSKASPKSQPSNDKDQTKEEFSLPKLKLKQGRHKSRKG